MWRIISWPISSSRARRSALGKVGSMTSGPNTGPMIMRTGVRRRRRRLGMICSVPRKAAGRMGAPLRTAR